MKMHLQKPTDIYLIRGHAKGLIQIGEQEHRTSLLILPDRLITDGWPASVSGLTETQLATLLALRPELVLLGSGERLQRPPAALLRPFAEAAIGVDVMDTFAACRTYNVLAAEGRKVAALLLLPQPD